MIVDKFPIGLRHHEVLKNYLLLVCICTICGGHSSVSIPILHRRRSLSLPASFESQLKSFLISYQKITGHYSTLRFSEYIPFVKNLAFIFITLQIGPH